MDTPKAETQDELERWRMKDYRELRKLHPGNRFRLMFGQSLLPQPGYDPDKDEENKKETKKN